MRLFLALSILCFSPISIAMNNEIFSDEMSMNQRLECASKKTGNKTCQEIYNESQNLKLKLLEVKGSCYENVDEDKCTKGYESLENYFKSVNHYDEIIEYVADLVTGDIYSGNYTAYDESQYYLFLSDIFNTKLKAERNAYKDKLIKVISEQNQLLETDENSLPKSEVNHYIRELADLNTIEKLRPVYIDALCNPSYGNGFGKLVEYYSCQLKLTKAELDIPIYHYLD